MYVCEVGEEFWSRHAYSELSVFRGWLEQHERMKPPGEYRLGGAVSPGWGTERVGSGRTAHKRGKERKSGRWKEVQEYVLSWMTREWRVPEKTEVWRSRLWSAAETKENKHWDTEFASHDGSGDLMARCFMNVVKSEARLQMNEEEIGGEE